MALAAVNVASSPVPPPGGPDRALLSWRWRRAGILPIVQQSMGKKSVGLGEGESVGRNSGSVAPVSGASVAKRADGLPVCRP